MSINARQDGIILVMSMLFILLLSLLAIASLQTTILEQKMTSAMERSLEQQRVARLALRQIEGQVMANKSWDHYSWWLDLRVGVDQFQYPPEPIVVSNGYTKKIVCLQPGGLIYATIKANVILTIVYN